MINSQILNNEIVESQEISALDNFHAFEERLHIVLKKHLHKFQALDILSSEEKQMIFTGLCYTCPPQSALGCVISDSQFDEINIEYHKIIDEFRFNHEGEEISLVDFRILASFYKLVYHGIKNRKRSSQIKESFAMPFLEGISLLKLLPSMYTACFSNLINRLNDVNNQTYSFEMIAKQTGSGIMLTPVFNIKTESIFSQGNELNLSLRVKEEKKQGIQYQTGFQYIYNLKSFNRNRNTMQEANYDEFLSYIKQGEDAELTIDNSNREVLALQSHSIWKLLKLLAINTLGLVVTQIAKVFYSLFDKFKRLLNHDENMNAKPSNQESPEYHDSKLFVSNSFNVVNKKTSNFKKHAI